MGNDEVPSDEPPIDVGGRAVQVSVDAAEACVWLANDTIRCWGWTDWWDGFDEDTCWIETEIPADGSHGSYPTIEREFSCDLHSRCCLGDDELPVDGDLVPL